MAIQPSQCSVFIQVWVDSKTLQNNSNNGIYLVDNRLNNGSSNEGGASLKTAANTNDYVCWSIADVNVNSGTILSLQNFGNSNAFGTSGTPQQINPTTWTGQVQNNGTASYSINFSAQTSSGSAITCNTTASFNVS